MANLTRKALSEYVALVRSLGGECVDMLAGRHPKMLIRTPGGKVFVQGVASTLGDSKRGMLNWRAEVRRKMQQMDEVGRIV